MDGKIGHKSSCRGSLGTSENAHSRALFAQSSLKPQDLWTEKEDQMECERAGFQEAEGTSELSLKKAGSTMAKGSKMGWSRSEGRKDSPKGALSLTNTEEPGDPRCAGQKVTRLEVGYDAWLSPAASSHPWERS